MRLNNKREEKNENIIEKIGHIPREKIQHMIMNRFFCLEESGKTEKNKEKLELDTDLSLSMRPVEFVLKNEIRFREKSFLCYFSVTELHIIY